MCDVGVNGFVGAGDDCRGVTGWSDRFDDVVVEVDVGCDGPVVEGRDDGVDDRRVDAVAAQVRNGVGVGDRESGAVEDEVDLVVGAGPGWSAERERGCGGAPLPESVPITKSDAGRRSVSLR